MKPRPMDVEKEFDDVCSLINDAYEVETGNEGVSFKKKRRYPDPSRGDENLKKNMRETWVVERDGHIVGCVRYFCLL